MKRTVVQILLFVMTIWRCSENIAGGTGAGNPGITMFTVSVEYGDTTAGLSDTVAGKGIPAINIRDAAHTKFRITDGYLLIRKISFILEKDDKMSNIVPEPPLFKDDSGGAFYIEGPFRIEMHGKAEQALFPEFRLPAARYTGITFDYDNDTDAVALNGTFTWKNAVMYGDQSYLPLTQLNAKYGAVTGLEAVKSVLKTDNNVSTNPVDDGSQDRILMYGKSQYWGTFFGKERPVVMITHAVSDDAVDIQVVFNPLFFDLTYGSNVIGWKRHTFDQLVKSDHVEITAVNKNNAIVFSGKLDLISRSTKYPSGYACLGPFGGDGEIKKGDPANILSYGSSLDDNINYYGYHLFQNSPATDSLYTPDPHYPNWQYYPIYRISLKRSAFGESGYGGVEMTYCHASPAKDGDNETVTVKMKNPPIPGSPEDPFRYLPPVIKPPPVVDPPVVDPPVTPPGGVD